MAMNLNEYFDLRCDDTLNALQNMQMLFADLQQHISHQQLRDIINQQNDVIQTGLNSLSQITNRPISSHYEPQTNEQANVADTSEERLVLVGRTWSGTIGRSTVEQYRIFVTRIPQYLIDTNAAMLSEEVCHFNLGNYTGLIVLAKELGRFDQANMLQDCIDRENALRMRIEDSLWQIVRSSREAEMGKAA